MMKQRIFVAGHRGMVGSAIVRLLAARDNVELVLRTRDELNLLDARAVQHFLPPSVSTRCTWRRRRWEGLWQTILTPLILFTKI